MGVGDFKSTLNLIQVFSKLLIHLSAGGGVVFCTW